MKVTTDAVQILGGYGYIQDYKVERYMRDAKHPPALAPVVASVPVT